MNSLKTLIHSDNKNVSLLRHAVITALAVAGVSLLHTVVGMDFGSYTPVVDGVVALILRAASSLVPEDPVAI